MFTVTLGSLRCHHQSYEEQAMATVTITRVYCVKEASGTDLDSLGSVIGDAFRSTLPRELSDGISPGDAVESIADLVVAIDEVSASPDDLFITTDTDGDIDNSIWPPDKDTQEIQRRQLLTPNVSVEFTDAVNISLWDEDTSGNDLLASVQAFETEMGTVQTKFGYSEVEGSAYYVTYRVE
ncbi:hypothetical protein C5E43_26290 [Nocardia cyriacigeorgica]|nr:hypothetical protein C5E43_26290 [Nocardia cyriacigeorgica]